MNIKYTYKAFGLTIGSSFPIPEFIASEGIPEVTIFTGNVPSHLQQISKKGVRFQATKNEFLLEVDHIARFYVYNGTEIRIEPYTGKINKEVRLFLLGSVFGALLLQRGLLPIHGSTIKIGNSAIIFSGISGVGKSSIAASFIKKGFSFLADDISVINKDLLVAPSFPKIKIWQDILQNLDISSEKLSAIRPNFKKFHLPLEKSFYQVPLPVKEIFIINTKNTPGYEYKEITGLQKFSIIANNTYRYRFVEGLQQQVEHFEILNKLLPNIKVYLVSRPQSPILLNEFTEYLIDNFALNE